MTISRDSRIGRGYIAREGDTGSVVWASSRDALAVSKGAARMSVGGRPGQLVFSDGASVFGAGESRYPQDVAYICSGDGTPASIYAGRYLAKWPLQSSFSPSEGYAAEAILNPSPGTGIIGFGTLGGKLCLLCTSGYANMQTAYSYSYRSTGFTFSFGFYQTGGATQQAQLYSGTPIFANGGGVVTWGADADDYSVSRADVAGQWTHYAVSFGATTAKLYINGVVVDTKTIAAACRTRVGPAFQINAGVNGYRNMRVYSKVLSAAEIAALAAEDLA